MIVLVASSLNRLRNCDRAFPIFGHFAARRRNHHKNHLNTVVAIRTVSAPPTFVSKTPQWQMDFLADKPRNQNNKTFSSLSLHG